MKELGRGSGDKCFLMANEAKQKGELMRDVYISSLFVRLAPLQEYNCIARVHLVQTAMVVCISGLHFNFHFSVVVLRFNIFA